MPTYEYECKKCGHRFEEFQSMTADPLSTCPECGGPVKRLIGAGAGLLFKGSGFYLTDYRSESYKKRAKKETGVTKSTPKKEEKKAGNDG
jgi:putative FmdB family regulatory protein